MLYGFPNNRFRRTIAVHIRGVPLEKLSSALAEPGRYLSS